MSWQAAEAQASEVMEEKSGLAIKHQSGNDSNQP